MNMRGCRYERRILCFEKKTYVVICRSFCSDLPPPQLFAANLLKPLASLPGGGLGHGATFTIQDELQEFNVQIVVQHKDDWNELEVPEGFLLEGSADKSHAKAAAAAAAAADGEAAAAVAVEDADGVVVVEDGEDVAVVDEAEAQGAGTKRKAVEGAAEGPDGKKARTEA